MVKSYCNYGIYDEDTSHCLEVDDCVDSLKFYDGERFITIENVRIKEIKKDKITIETEDYDEIEIYIEDIVRWQD